MKLLGPHIEPDRKPVIGFLIRNWFILSIIVSTFIILIPNLSAAMVKGDNDALGLIRIQGLKEFKMAAVIKQYRDVNDRGRFQEPPPPEPPPHEPPPPEPPPPGRGPAEPMHHGPDGHGPHSPPR